MQLLFLSQGAELRHMDTCLARDRLGILVFILALEYSAKNQGVYH